MRILGRAVARAEAAVWDRLLSLPQSFFRKYSVGDIATRVYVPRMQRDLLIGTVSNSMLAVAFALPTFILLFVYDVTIGLVGLAYGLLSLAFVGFLSVRQVNLQTKLQAIMRRSAEDLFQFLTGIETLKARGAEGNAFAFWAKTFRKRIETQYYIEGYTDHVLSFSFAMPLLAAAVICLAVSLMQPGSLEAGDFLAIYAAMMVFNLSIMQFGNSMQSLAQSVPAYESLKPPLQAVPERATDSVTPRSLKGDLQIDRVTFRYSEFGPLILNDVSINARSGEFIAIVGESASGKSSLIRLALGLERPLTGSVYYDGKNLNGLNLAAVRRLTGVVTQNEALQSGTVLENIVGVSGRHSIEDAWKAARKASVDQDILHMPMQMFTNVGQNLSLLSAGQMQRVQIAAALIKNPAIIFLDEATSWLDTKTETRVSDAMRELSATRVVIAHRLTTIRDADRIYVMDAGRVVQTGTYDELMEAEGTFRNLAMRQLA